MTQIKITANAFFATLFSLCFVSTITLAGCAIWFMDLRYAGIALLVFIVTCIVLAITAEFEESNFEKPWITIGNPKPTKDNLKAAALEYLTALPVENHGDFERDLYLLVTEDKLS